VNQNNPNSDLIQYADLLNESARLIGVSENLSARLDDEDFSLEQANVGRGVFQCRNDNRAVFPGAHELPPSI
jgi:hypothetical protein